MNHFEPLTLKALRRVGRDMSVNNQPGVRAPVNGPFVIEIHPDLRDAALALPNFMPVENYRTMRPRWKGEVGCVEVFRVRVSTQFYLKGAKYEAARAAPPWRVLPDHGEQGAYRDHVELVTG